MRCKDFLTLYSDFRDDVIVDPAMNRRMREHLSQCPRCARYHSALEVGTRTLRETHDLEASERFLINLRCRLALAGRRLKPVAPAFGWPASIAVTLLIVVGVVRAVTSTNGAAREPSPPQVASAPDPRPAQSGAAVRARFEALTPPDFRPPALRFAPARLDLNGSRLETWRQVDSSPGFVAVHATLSR